LHGIENLDGIAVYVNNGFHSIGIISTSNMGPFLFWIKEMWIKWKLNKIFSWKIPWYQWNILYFSRSSLVWCC
jgi:hypothetical protein